MTEMALREFSPRIAPPRFDDAAIDVAYAVHETAVGALVIAVDTKGRVLRCSYDDEAAAAAFLAAAVSPRVLRVPARLDSARRQIDEYLAGTRRQFELELAAPALGRFPAEVLAAAATVPYGSTTSYGRLAALVGSPRAARAVGNALGANPICLLVPCHRVLLASGHPGGYAGGANAKLYLLALERGGG